ncbi:MAG: homoserine dehydrogenase [FCB group bacterium]|nr:homoserine dehydrogenase [FCB group bacterium]
MTQKITIIGFGTVGQGLCEILAGKKKELLEKYNYRYSIVAVCDPRFGTVYNAAGLDMERVIAELRADQKFTTDRYPWDALETIRNSNADVVCELAFTDLKTGEPAMSHCRTAFETGKHIVTSNKGPAALAYAEMKALAGQHNVDFRIEGTVMSGTPVLNLAEGPLAGCSISAVKGILNGTTNYMLSEMEQGLDYTAALEKAQSLGYAEADPTGDVEGYDARAKVTILANVVLGEKLSIDAVDCTGITALTAADIMAAKAENTRWKLIGSITRSKEGLTAYVRPERVPLTHPLAGIMGATNALTLTTDLLGDVTIVGAGAGKTETGFSILSDLLAIHRTETILPDNRL